MRYDITWRSILDTALIHDSIEVNDWHRSLMLLTYVLNRLKCLYLRNLSLSNSASFLLCLLLSFFLTCLSQWIFQFKRSRLLLFNLHDTCWLWNMIQLTNLSFSLQSLSLSNASHSLNSHILLFNPFLCEFLQSLYVSFIP